MQKRLSTYSSNSGFTMIELAVVIVIIALLVLTVSVGKNLISASKVRAVVKEVEELQGAVVRFEDKFMDLPGDIQDASNYFGCTAMAAPMGCNGDGNTEVVWDPAATATDFHEGAMVFFHLQLAEMLGGDPMNGQNGLAQHTVSMGTPNIPKSKIPGGGWSASNSMFDSNYFGLGAMDLGGSGDMNDIPVLEPKDAYSIDDKVDDGLPLSGRIQHGQVAMDPNWDNEDANCINGTAYRIEDNLVRCTLLFEWGSKL